MEPRTAQHTTGKEHASSSSFCRVTVANAPDVLQPCRLIVLPSDVPTLTTSRLRDPSSQRWNYVGEKWPMNFAWNARLPRNIQGTFTCRKSTTWDRRLYFPSEGSRAEDFFALKNPTDSAGFEPANLSTKGQHATPRPPKPLKNMLTTNVSLIRKCLEFLT
jgi:hypothetical protein